jgi:antitoxin VapB
MSKYLTAAVIYITIYTMSRTAKLFRNGRSQAVRLPAEYRFEGPEVYIRRDPNTGDVILSRRPESWKEFFELADRMGVPEDFMSDRGDVQPQERKLF